MEEKSAVEALAALAQGTRLNAFRLLVRAGTEGMTAGAVAEALGVPAATLAAATRPARVATITFTARARIGADECSMCGSLAEG